MTDSREVEVDMQWEAGHQPNNTAKLVLPERNINLPRSSTTLSIHHARSTVSRAM